MRRGLRWLTSLFQSRRAFDADMRDEFAFHVEARTTALVGQGWTPEDAARQARIEFGSIAGYEERTRTAGGLTVIDDFRRDVQFGARMLRRQPGTALVIVLTLALGIGANTAMFSVVDAVLLRKLPVPHPDQLVLFSSDASEGTQTSNTPPEGTWRLFSSEVYDALRARPLPFASLAAFASADSTVTTRVLESSTGTSSDTRSVAHLVSGTYFEVLGAPAALGRTLTPAEDRAGAAPVAVVSDHFWKTSLGGSPSAIGQVVRVNKTAFTVVGVMPESFFGTRVRSAPDLWVPLVWQPQVQLRESIIVRPDYYWLSLIGRLEPGQSQQAAQTAVTAALRQFLTDRAGSSIDDAARDRIARVGVEMASGARGISTGRAKNVTPLTLLLAAVGLVLLIACANIATLLLCRAASRGHEVSIRRALGAGRIRLVRQWLTESLLLAVVGAAAGLLVAYWTAPWLLTFFPAGPLRATVNLPVLMFATGIALVASGIFGLAPAIQAGRADALAALRSSGRGTAPRRRGVGAMEPFVIAQIAVSLVLVVAATLFVRSLFNLEREPLGFDQNSILLAKINPRLAGYTSADVGALYRRLYDQVSLLPGVESATFARYSPFGGNFSSFSASVDGYTPAPNEDLQLEAVEIGPNYPQTLGMPLVSGRAIGLADTAGAPLVAMVNEAFVKRFFPTSSPLGHRLRLNDDFEIVGVVRDALFHDARDQMIPFVFVALLQETSQRALDCEIELRVNGDAERLAADVRRVVAATDSRVAVTRTRTLRTQVLDTFGPQRLTAGFVMAFASFALLLAAVGLYGVVAYNVARRTKEIGVRVALGAARADIVWLVVRDTLTWLAAGITLGAIAAALLGRFVASQLFGVTARDVSSFAIAALALATVAIIASLLPAGRALRIHPTTALRTD